MQISLIALISVLSVFAAQEIVVAAPVPSPMFGRGGKEAGRQVKEQLKGNLGDAILDAARGGSTSTPTGSVNGRQLMNEQMAKDKADKAARDAQIATQQARIREARQSTPAQHPPSIGGGLAHGHDIAAGLAAHKELSPQKSAVATAAAAKATTGVADRQRKIAELEQRVQTQQRKNLGFSNKRSVEDLD